MKEALPLPDGETVQREHFEEFYEAIEGTKLRKMLGGKLRVGVAHLSHCIEVMFVDENGAYRCSGTPGRLVIERGDEGFIVRTDDSIRWVVKNDDPIH